RIRPSSSSEKFVNDETAADGVSDIHIREGSQGTARRGAHSRRAVNAGAGLPRRSFLYQRTPASGNVPTSIPLSARWQYTGIGAAATHPKSAGPTRTRPGGKS